MQASAPPPKLLRTLRLAPLDCAVTDVTGHPTTKKLTTINILASVLAKVTTTARRRT
jgi:hypothetical protein